MGVERVKTNKKSGAGAGAFYLLASQYLKYKINNHKIPLTL